MPIKSLRFTFAGIFPDVVPLTLTGSLRDVRLASVVAVRPASKPEHPDPPAFVA